MKNVLCHGSWPWKDELVEPRAPVDAFTTINDVIVKQLTEATPYRITPYIHPILNYMDYLILFVLQECPLELKWIFPFIP